MSALRHTAVDALDKVLDSALYKALAEPGRVRILGLLLLHGPSDVGTVAGNMALDRSVVSRHLKHLEEAGLVRHQKQGRKRVYSVRGAGVLDRLEEMGTAFRTAVETCCPEELWDRCAGTCSPDGARQKPG